MGYDLKTHKSDGGDFAPLPDERYEYKVLDAEVKTTATKKEMISTTFEVLNGSYKGRLAWNNFVLTEKSMGFLLSFLSAVGSSLVDGEDVSAQAIAKDIKGKVVSAYTIATKTSQGNPVNQLSRWQAVKGVDGDSSSPAGEKQAAFL